MGQLQYCLGDSVVGHVLTDDNPDLPDPLTLLRSAQAHVAGRWNDVIHLSAGGEILHALSIGDLLAEVPGGLPPDLVTYVAFLTNTNNNQTEEG